MAQPEVMQTPPPPPGVFAMSSAAQSSASTLTASIIRNNPSPAKPQTPNKRPADPDALAYHQSPSPKKAAPKFDVKPSDEDSVFSGDDEDDWAKEEERMMALVAAQIAAEEEEANNLVEEVVPVVYEFETGFAEDVENPIPPSAPIRVTITVTRSKMTIPQLKELYSKLHVSLPPDKKKASLFDALRDSEKTTKIDQDSFSYELDESPGQATNQPKWEILIGQEVNLPSGFDACGVEEGYYAPTNQEGAEGATKLEYLTGDGERIKRPDFDRKPRKSEQGRPKGSASKADGPPSEHGRPSDFAQENLPKNFSWHRPKHYFDLFLTPKFVETFMVRTTNERAAAEGAGSRTYKDFVGFDTDEMYKMFGLLFANAVSPKPQFPFWFKSTNESRIFGNDFFANALDKKMPGGRTIKGERRWKHFRRFMCMYDWRMFKSKEQQKKDPLWKLTSILEELRKNSQKCWIPGKWVSIDEQTIAFKGAHGLALRITYKREGDGYQCDAVCEDGYTFSFYFRHGDAPKLPDSFKDLQLSNTAKRVIFLLLQLPNLWTHCFMDNLFNSRRLFTAAYRAKTLCHGVVRHHGRGVPDEIVQKKVTEAESLKIRNRTKAAVLRGDPDCPDLVCCSVYDQGPVHMMSTVAETIEWDQKSRRVWSSALGSKVTMKYLRLNLIDIYNNHMNSVDLADQLRNCYRFNHWFRNRKWWWSIFLWAIGVAATNAFIVYERTYEAEKAKKEVGLPRKWTHLEFLVELINDFMGWDSSGECYPEEDAPVASNTRAASVAGSVSSSVKWKYNFATVEGRRAYLEENHPSSITKNRMDTTFFMIRKDGQSHPMISAADGPAANCQLCRYKFQHCMSKRDQLKNAVMKNNRGGIRRCLQCNVNLCSECSNEWHGWDWYRINNMFNE